MDSASPASKPHPPRPRSWWGLLGLNVLLFIVACVAGLYAFMLNVDLGDVKRRLSKEVETRQQTERYLVETRNLLAQSQRELEQIQSRLDHRETDAQSMQSAKPALPLVVGFRSSLIGKGLVASIENTSDRYLTVLLSARNPTLATARRFKIELGPHSSTSVGHMEGWQFSSGDELALFHEDFAALRLNVP